MKKKSNSTNSTASILRKCINQWDYVHSQEVKEDTETLDDIIMIASGPAVSCVCLLGQNRPCLVKRIRLRNFPSCLCNWIVQWLDVMVRCGPEWIQRSYIQLLRLQDEQPVLLRQEIDNEIARADLSAQWSFINDWLLTHLLPPSARVLSASPAQNVFQGILGGVVPLFHSATYSLKLMQPLLPQIVPRLLVWFLF